MTIEIEVLLCNQAYDAVIFPTRWTPNAGLLTRFLQAGEQGGPLLSQFVGTSEAAITTTDHESIYAFLDKVICSSRTALDGSEGLTPRSPNHGAALQRISIVFMSKDQRTQEHKPRSSNPSHRPTRRERCIGL